MGEPDGLLRKFATLMAGTRRISQLRTVLQFGDYCLSQEELLQETKNTLRGYPLSFNTRRAVQTFHSCPAEPRYTILQTALPNRSLPLLLSRRTTRFDGGRSPNAIVPDLANYFRQNTP